MSRRWKGPRGDWSLFGLLLVVGVAGHLSWAMTPVLQVQLHPLPWIVAVYLGYKMGRLTGLVAGGLSVLPWTVVATLQGEGSGDRFSWRELVLGGGWLEPFPQAPWLSVRTFSLQELVIAAFLGYAAGWAFDGLERRLGPGPGSTLDDLLPAGRRRGPLPALIGWVERRLTGSPQGSPPAWRSLLRRVGGLSLPVLFVLFNLGLVLYTAQVRWSLPPRLLAAVAILLVAFVLGSGLGAALAIVVWLGSWAAWLTIATDLGGEGLLGGGTVELGLRDVPQVVGLSILAWWAARLGEILHDEKRRGALRALWASALRSEPARAAPAIALAGVLAVLALGFEADLGPLRVAYGPHYLWFVVLSLWASRRDPARVSSRAFWLLLLLGAVGFDQRGGGPLDERPGLELFTLGPDATQAVLLAALPLVAGRLDLGRLASCRALAYGFLAAWTLSAVFLDGGLFKDDYAVSLLHFLPRPSEYGGNSQFAEYGLPVASWVLQLLLFELAARWLHRAAGRSERRSALA